MVTEEVFAVVRGVSCETVFTRQARPTGKALTLVIRKPTNSPESYVSKNETKKKALKMDRCSEPTYFSK